MDSIKKNLKRITLADLILVGVFVFGVIFFVITFFRKSAYVNVVVKVNEESVLFTPWQKEVGNSDWFANLFYEGMYEKDSLGKKQAEVVSVKAFDTRPGRKSVYLTLKLLSVYAKSTETYSFNGKPLLVGSTAKFELGGISMTGLVTSVEGQKDEHSKVKLIAEVKLKDENSVYLETGGVEEYIADAITVGAEIKNSLGETELKISGKKVNDAKRLVVTSDGKTLVRTNPLRKDVSLTLEVNATKIGEKYYVLDDLPLIIGQKLPINTNNLFIFPEITKISLAE